jgi:DinB superfamily
MHPSKSLSKFEQLLAQYEKALDLYSEEEFLKQPDADSWSVGQVYVHLCGSAQFFHLKHVEQCLLDMSDADGSKAMPGRITYFLGGMPAIKIKVPASTEYTPPQPKDKAYVREKMRETAIIMSKMAEKLEQSSQSGKTKHPAFGYLDAKEWYQLVPMHFKHHLRQIARLNKFLGK